MIDFAATLTCVVLMFFLNHECTIREMVPPPCLNPKDRDRFDQMASAILYAVQLKDRQISWKI